MELTQVTDLLAAPWFWLAIGCVLLVIEMLMPGTMMLWFGVGALLTALLAWLIPGDLPWVNLLLFGLSSLLGLILGRNVWKRFLSQSEDTDLNDRGASMVGQVVEVHRAIRAGATGSVRVGDTVWRARLTRASRSGVSARSPMSTALRWCWSSLTTPDAAQTERRAFIAASSVPSSRYSSEPPTGTPCATALTSAPSSRNRSAR